MIKGILCDDLNRSYKITIDMDENNDINVYDFYNKYVFTYEIKKSPGDTYFKIFRYVLNRYKEYLDKYGNWVPYDQYDIKGSPAVFACEEFAKEHLDKLIEQHKYGIDPKPKIISY